MNFRLASLIGILAVPVSGQEAKPAQVPLTPESLEHWRRHITPTAAETAWSNLPWHRSLHAGLNAASRAGRPLLLWTMNGHPFGCT